MVSQTLYNENRHDRVFKGVCAQSSCIVESTSGTGIVGLHNATARAHHQLSAGSGFWQQQLVLCDYGLCRASADLAAIDASSIHMLYPGSLPVTICLFLQVSG